jgi:hypothetical protein
LKKEFYVEYCKLFLNEDLNKIKLIIDILKLYNKDLKPNFKLKIESELNSYYSQTGNYLIDNQKLKNVDLLKFLKDNPEFNNIDNIDKCIVIDGKDVAFINEFLNDKFENIKIKNIFGNNYYRISKYI